MQSASIQTEWGSNEDERVEQMLWALSNPGDLDLSQYG